MKLFLCFLLATLRFANQLAGQETKKVEAVSAPKDEQSALTQAVSSTCLIYLKYAGSSDDAAIYRLLAKRLRDRIGDPEKLSSIKAKMEMPRFDVSKDRYTISISNKRSKDLVFATLEVKYTDTDTDTSKIFAFVLKRENRKMSVGEILMWQILLVHPSPLEPLFELDLKAIK